MPNLYHVSPVINHKSIQISGIDPVWSKGKRQTCWFADFARLPFALAHVSYLKRLPVGAFEVWTISTDDVKKIEKTAWPGIFQTPCRHEVFFFTSAERALMFIREAESF